MAPPDLSGELPGNLACQAVDDLIPIFRRSTRDFGVIVARRSRDRLLARLRSVEDGIAIGPWVICFNLHTRQVYRILHGARDFPAIFGRPAAGSSEDHDIA